VSAHIKLDELDAIVFDFDGVLTDNKVLIDSSGNEWVSCHRGDGLAFDVFRFMGVKTYILSTEKNPVVSVRAKKLQVPLIQGISNKSKTLEKLAQDNNLQLSRVLYIGNDLNDFRAMKLCGFSACPSDSHFRIKEIASIKLKTAGGAGIVRELLEDVMNIDIIQTLYPE